ncbi:hypothetical protein [Evansella cellulosilytica]|uniref:Uncharacterized protein n=1 Tax=Evansella cellulosilytica (strain ATCC 21833 / DSM 2522 / FERM P-1141 / JCM 9156 / N-4) TaxID=649639 RepID=E6U246_EVAC2|nr:hypothetical protein [Evansella cellulosilytica]ADU30424.1 hypothetical protein Bcell_2163 [Evansella cellulosilytica DSM 2522]
MKKTKNYEPLFWSIALPGFGQLLNKQYLKGIVFILAEFIVNVQSNFNVAIVHSFNGNIEDAIHVTDYQWLMFYPCLYMFSLWDAHKDANSPSPYMYFPFAFGAYFVTVGLIYSHTFTLFGVLIGPVFLPMLFLLPGLAVGFIIRALLLRKSQQSEERF